MTATQLEQKIEEYEDKFGEKPPVVNILPKQSVEMIDEAIKTGTPIEDSIPEGADS